MHDLYHKAQDSLGLGMSIERAFLDVYRQISKSRKTANYVLCGTLGEGGFGEVAKAVDATTSEEFAIKLLEKSTIESFEDIQRVYTEIHTLRDLRHTNVIRMFDVALKLSTRAVTGLLQKK
ncbi:NUAK SNF1-like kinase 1 [Perkinsus olseni]|uniref:NUAK SNF1-like kinase 1 n=1 Tax=Perkinsus olseni TaxID=32597 RepID=A0A7J6UM60_PEROL|nr:NUAK SNF1-like kinase 1 [Perkinsus olseni]KAF4725352.1 NUAK SNF1-like kinase 1 [Perkinsus olseni]KAF4758081.1 NUAK SNF1-like kinase 1 [Perkinsus olseni]